VAALRLAGPRSVPLVDPGRGDPVAPEADLRAIRSQWVCQINVFCGPIGTAGVVEEHRTEASGTGFRPELLDVFRRLLVVSLNARAG
jgi:hypothetical protein